MAGDRLSVQSRAKIRHPWRIPPVSLSRILAVFAVCALVGYATVHYTHAATYMSAAEAEGGTLAGGATSVTDSNASGGSAVRFGSGGATQSTNCTPSPASTMTNTVSHLCGFPDTTNAGATGTLTNVPGSITGPTASTGSGWTYNSSQQAIIIDTDGAVLKNITTSVAEIVVQANDVTIDNVKVTAADQNGFGVWLRGPNNDGTSNVTVENSTISGGNTGSQRLLAGIKDIYGDSTGTKLLNNNIYYISTGIQIDEGLIEGNYIHDMGMISGDHVNGTTSGGGTTQMTIQNNTIFNQYSQTDAISLFEDFGVQSNRIITGNLVAGGGYCIYGGQNSGGAAASDISITNNHFSRMFFPDCGGQGGGVIAAWPLNGSGGVWSGNVWDDTGAAVSD